MTVDNLVVWLLFALYVWLVPERPHEDALRWRSSIQAGVATFNPNYLLIQPLAVGFFKLWRLFSLPANVSDATKAIDVIAGGIGLWIFSATLRRFVAGVWTRAWALLLAGFSFGYLYLSTSDHIKILTAPTLAGGFFFLLKYAHDQHRKDLVAAAICVALSVALLINAMVWAIMIMPLVLLIGPSRRRLGDASVYTLSAVAVCAAIFVPVFLMTAGHVTFLKWLSSYGATSDSSLNGPAGGLAMMVARGGFAAMKNFVFSENIGPIVKALVRKTAFTSRLGWSDTMNVVASVAFAIGIAYMVLLLILRIKSIQKADLRALAVAATMIAAFAIFGAWWSDSDEEFWFQITWPVLFSAALICDRLPASRLRALGATCVLALVAGNNLATFALPRNAEHYREDLAAFQAAIGPTDLVIAGGAGPVSIWIGDAWGKDPAQAFVIAGVLTKNGFNEKATIEAMLAAIESARASNRRVWVFDVFDAKADAYPWSIYGERQGVGPEPFKKALEQLGGFEKRPVAHRMAWVLDPGSGPPR